MLNLDLGDYVTGSILALPNAPSSCSECKQHDTRNNVHTLMINGRVSDIQIKMAAETEVGSRIGFTANGSGGLLVRDTSLAYQ